MENSQSRKCKQFFCNGIYFGRLLQQQLKVPVALINVTYGGSPAEAFMNVRNFKNHVSGKLHCHH
ncbi:MAG: hypothetical protein WDM90_06850 [Ferruginibacter sp.]